MSFVIPNEPLLTIPEFMLIVDPYGQDSMTKNRTFSPTPQPLGRAEGLEIEFHCMAVDLISHANIMKLISPDTEAQWTFLVGEHIYLLGG